MWPGWYRQTWFWLPLIVLAGAALRLYSLSQAPPALNTDEACNAWNAYCLLETGTDQFGAGWPIFFFRAFGENRSALFLYLLLPFQALGGLNVWTTRLPSAVAGTVAIALIYYVGTRLCGRRVGLVAAALLAVSPWAIQQSRWGHEAGVCPLLVLAPFAAWLWARLPISGSTKVSRSDENATEDPSKRRGTGEFASALIAGALTGVCCYGYPAARLFIPLFFAAAAAVAWPAWCARWHSPNGRKGIVGLLVGLAVTLGPLLTMHFIDPQGIGKRASDTWLWEASDSTSVIPGKVFARYLAHFGLDFLFVHGDSFIPQSPPGGGVLGWYMLPLLLSGVIAAFRQERTSLSARILLVGVLAYPTGDCLSRHESLHALRSLPGLPALALMAAFGATALLEFVQRSSRATAGAAAGILVIAVAAAHVRFVREFFGPFSRSNDVYAMFQVDLTQACEWLRPRLDNFDAVYFTATRMNLPYAVTHVHLGYDPHRWFRGQRQYRMLDGWEECMQYGKLHFFDQFSGPPQLDGEWAPHGHVLFIVRPGEVHAGKLVNEIRRPEGDIALQMFEGDM